MKVLSAIFGTLLCGSALAQQAPAYTKKYDGRPGVTTVNQELRSMAPDAAKKFLLITGITFGECDRKGQPKKKFSETLATIDDATKQQLGMLGVAVRAGSFTYNCTQLGYYYLSDTADVRMVLETFYKQNFPEYTRHIHMRPDPQWEVYLRYLYPDVRRTAMPPPNQ